MTETTPEDFICPITQELFQTPVVASDGHTYEKKAMKKWLDTGNRISPCTGLPLKTKKLIENFTLKKIIDNYKENMLKGVTQMNELDNERKKTSLLLKKLKIMRKIITIMRFKEKFTKQKPETKQKTIQKQISVQKKTDDNDKSTLKKWRVYLNNNVLF